MAIVAHLDLPAITKEQYDQVRAEAGWLEEPPVSGSSHVPWWKCADCHNVDAWASEEAFNKLRHRTPRAGPVWAKQASPEPRVTFHPAHEVYTTGVGYGHRLVL